MNAPKWLKSALLIISAIVYLNIGYQFSSIAEGINKKGSPDTFIENVISGGWNWMHVHGRHNTVDHILSLLFWPISILLSLISWILFFFIEFVICVWEGIQFLWWFTFCGGLNKMIGTGGIVFILTILLIIFLYYSKRS